MADQSKAEGRFGGKSENKAGGSSGGGGSGSGGGGGGGGGGYGGGGERAGTSSNGSESSGPQRLRKGRGFFRWKQYTEAKRGSPGRGFSRASRFVREDCDDASEGQEASGIRYSPHTSRFKREKWWERGGSRIHVTVRRQDGDRPSQDRGVTISNQNPPSKQWFKITIPNGKKYDKTWLLSTIQGKCSVPFNPIEFHYENNKAHFFVEDAHTASALKDLNYNIKDYDNRRISIIINSSGPPFSIQNELKPEQVEQLKFIMSKRYDSSQKSLNLKGLRSDPNLMAQNIDIVLNRKNYMSAAIQIIGENIPELLALNLSNNRIYKLDDFSEIVPKAPNLKILNLSGNELKSEGELDKVKELKLDELWLKGNPLCKVFQDQSSYLSAIRERFPKLLRLDGCELPPPIAFDVESLTTLPDCKGSYFGSETMKGMVMYFLQQYYSVYDTGNRQGLLEAYHEGACCSLSLPVSLQNPSSYNLSEYVKDNRNVKKLKDPTLRFRLLKHSRLTVVAFLNELPKTQHDVNSFVVDVCAQTQTLLCFSVHGVFKEVDEKSHDTIRAFTRVFIAVPSNNATRMCMVNDELFVRNANAEEIQKAFATPPPPLLPRPPLPASSSSSMATVSQEKQNMLQSFSIQSGMNLEWSQKCLQDNNWDFARAAQVFTQLQVEGKIPAVAFLK
ncbi:nuclear RNA export factor 1-like [Dromiciops gliroides]|uniref:nuclear RNA export factor 1-like n=1 Tax=Dromiciops gliroides TaxID=33562 RepID=UPI001CC41FE9|nr:nuclear RNA export factor 1-like [Dromiciops gliroides]